MHLAFVWQKEWNFFPPAEFHFGRIANWYCTSITELWSELQKSCSVLWASLVCLNSLKGLCWAASHSAGSGSCSSGQDRSFLGIWGSTLKSKSIFSPFFHLSENPKKLTQLNQENLLHTSCFVYKELIEASASHFFTYSQPSCTVPHQMNPCSWWFLFKLPCIYLCISEMPSWSFLSINWITEMQNRDAHCSSQELFVVWTGLVHDKL